LHFGTIMTLRNMHHQARFGRRGGWVAASLAAACAALFAFALFAFDALADLSAAVHLMA